MEVANTLAYYDTATITAVKSFIGQAPASFFLASGFLEIKCREFKERIQSEPKMDSTLEHSLETARYYLQLNFN